MLGYIPISSLPNSASPVEFIVEILEGNLRAPNLYISGTFGIIGELILPKLEISGTIATVNYLQGNLTSPKLEVN